MDSPQEFLLNFNRLSFSAEPQMLGREMLVDKSLDIGCDREGQVENTTAWPAMGGYDGLVQRRTHARDLTHML